MVLKRVRQHLNQCGFFVPSQRIPYIEDPIREITEGIEILRNLGIYIHRLPVLGVSQQSIKNY